ncbi:MAG: hypothetical protein QNJ70_29205 [Xenococcaceae cyanobacterium MO_207.B15]|nr:hypothetical protein [Xenococcaceae cyanobacterium MO_207.B15]MDJ0742033.1 hypothetical protein [Xenococcaceae cyanobacterium MO_167.B27]
MSGAYSEPELRKPVLPSEIALCILKAIQAGWKSNLSGKKFMFDVREDCFTTNDTQ